MFNFFNKKNKEEKKKDDELSYIQDLISNGENMSAINELELYIDKNKKLGKSFQLLMQLYNNELAISRQKKDDEEIKKWLDKIDELMKKSKDIVRGR